MKKTQNLILKLAAYLGGGIVIAITLFLFAYIFIRGLSSISPQFILDRPRGIPLGTEGGVRPAIIGTLYLGALSGIISGLIASMTAIYLVFYCKNKALKGIIRGSIYFLSGMPSILFGLVGYTILLTRLHMPPSLLTAGITVSVMILPFITMRIIKIFKEDTMELQNASLCLGLPKSYIIRKLILPHYLIDMLASIALGIAYGVGAAAPVMLTGAVLFAETPRSLNQPFMSLSYHLYILISQGISLENAYASAFLLLLLLLTVNLSCRALGQFRKGGNKHIGN